MKKKEDKLLFWGRDSKPSKVTPATLSRRRICQHPGERRKLWALEIPWLTKFSRKTVPGAISQQVVLRNENGS